VAVLDVVTLAEAKAALNIDVLDTTQDTELAALITGVSHRLDSGVGPVVQRALTVRHNGGRPAVQLKRRPAATFTTVTEYDSYGIAMVLTAEDEAIKPADSYLAERYEPNQSLFNGRLVRRRSGSDRCFEPGRANVVVVYTAGRAANTAVVEPIYKEAAQIMLANLWRSQEQSIASVGEFDVPAQAFPRFAVPNAVKQLLADEWQDYRPRAVVG